MKISREDKIKKDNITGLFKNPQTRPFVFITGAVVVGMIGLGIMSLGKTGDDVPASVSVGRVDSVEHTPGVGTTAEHDRLQKLENERLAREAAAQGKTNMPTLTGGNEVNDPLVLPSTTPPPVATTPVTQPPVYTPPAPVISAPVISAPVTETVAPVVKSEASQVLVDQMTAYLQMWGPGSKELQEYKYAGTRDQSEKEQGQDPNLQSSAQSAQTVATSSMLGAAATKSGSSQPAIRYIRAGTMIPAMLITPLNSDTPGPVIAQISSGPLAGARLIGEMKKNGNSILVGFSTISKPGWPDTYQVSAIGMDLKSSTALASDVNHHYLSRYLSILGGSYLSGYGQGLSQSGRASNTSILDGVINIEQKDLTSAQIRDKAMGEVLTEAGGNIKEGADRETTIKVAGPNGQPYPLRILFMENF